MLGHQPNHVTKEERVENLWKKLIRQETDLSEETIAWMALRIRQLTEYMPYGCALIAYRKQNGCRDGDTHDFGGATGIESGHSGLIKGARNHIHAGHGLLRRQHIGHFPERRCHLQRLLSLANLCF